MMPLSLLVMIAFLLVAETRADEALSKAKGCHACHMIDNKLLGPTYKDISKKYSGQKEGEAKIAQSIIKGTPFPGGVGWQKDGKATMAFMPPKATVNPDEAAKLAKWITRLK